MKTSLLLLLFTALLSAQVSLSVGGKIQSVRDAEGDGAVIRLFYDDFALESSLNRFNLYLPTFVEYTTYRFGARYDLARFSDERIVLFASLGMELLDNQSTKLTSKSGFTFNSYGMLGVEFFIDLDRHWSVGYALGSGGKGELANNYPNSPNYAHGVNMALEIVYNFKVF